jgi:hypothetical protein
MTKKKTETEDIVQQFGIGIEQICAAMIASFGKVALTSEALLANYEGKAISVHQNTDTGDVEFELVDSPVEGQAGIE